VSSSLGSLTALRENANGRAIVKAWLEVQEAPK
jgi:hypothetical protein